ncbi:MAG: lipoyl synthase [Bacteroidetes bacterium GWE2_39_28]|nr:MAG: lipoyl synthase [Bacteroidetes bacterium GWE2_39_28]OFY15276.1 MAG: lipoyl synthase [Bacteroidetes bacterium GWF2_39_10]OFZ08730.1 MAG: lipoyl synthase [Bacteroidetes bacterium RIFOXYB2_FULL_39_7]OFZ11123.1 MAG: lipoyl synthase [Bacteroidetes bacterium RIFOXYC2_FULL_39_11]HCT93909.1 lipoyl synthase [Rikenellaceae bacterium]
MQKRDILKPDWLKIKLSTDKGYGETGRIIREHSLNTICSSGRCPNQNECWSRGTATFMILGDICTRSCGFCATKTGKPSIVNDDEAYEVAQSVKLLGLKHCVITSVTRDDLDDQGANHWFRVINECKRVNPETTIEILIPDFRADKKMIDLVISAKPHIIGHNIETIQRLTPAVRSGANYQTSLNVLKHLSKSGVYTKSGLMAGLGERPDEVEEALRDLYNYGCRIVTVGQYLKPGPNHIPVVEYITPQQFDYYSEYALKTGFDYAFCGPLVRSSYMAEKALDKLKSKV